MAISYCFDKARFLTPVPSGARVRARFTLQGIDDKKKERWLLRLGVQVEIENDDGLGFVADWLTIIAF